MTNLLKQISLIVLFLTGGIRPACQNFKHHLTFPIGTIQVTNVPGFQFDISSTYVNNFYLPNIKYTIEWNKFIFGVEYYNFYKYIGYEGEVDGAITGMNIYSYSAFIGMGSKINKFNFNLGTGLSYLNHYISSYTDGFPQWFEVRPCYEFSKIRFLSFISVDRLIYKKVTLGINIRYSPMFRPFSDKDYGYYTCNTLHNHDRINFANLQLFIGYRFGKN